MASESKAPAIPRPAPTAPRSLSQVVPAPGRGPRAFAALLDRPEISVVVPVYRSEAIVPHLCQAVRDALDGRRFELVLVNDRSPDGSWGAIAQEAAADPRVLGVDLRVNVGQDRAIMAGLSHASGDVVVIMDDDLQHRPSDIPAMLGALGDFDVCFAAFFEKKQTLVKNAGSWLAGKVAERVLRKPPAIYMSPFKAIRREVVEAILDYRGPFPYVDGLLFQITDHVTQITVEHQARFSGRTTHDVWKQSHVFFNLVTNFSTLPLRAMLLGGLGIAALSFVLGLYFLGVWLARGIAVEGWTALMLVNLFTLGSVMVMLGFLGEYLGRVLLNVNQLPQFVVRDTTRSIRGNRVADPERNPA